MVGKERIKLGLTLSGCIAVVLFVAVAVSRTVTQATTAPEGGSTLLVRVADSENYQPLPEVAVLAVTRSGLIVESGKTDKSGRVQLSKNDLREQQAIVLLFCKEYFFCGAMRTDESGFFEYDERLIHLARFVVP